MERKFSLWTFQSQERNYWGTRSADTLYLAVEWPGVNILTKYSRVIVVP